VSLSFLLLEDKAVVGCRLSRLSRRLAPPRNEEAARDQRVPCSLVDVFKAVGSEMDAPEPATDTHEHVLGV